MVVLENVHRFPRQRAVCTRRIPTLRSKYNYSPNPNLVLGVYRYRTQARRRELGGFVILSFVPLALKFVGEGMLESVSSPAFNF